MARLTIRQLFRDTKPQRLIAAPALIGRSDASEIARGMPATTRAMAKIAGRVLVPRLGRRKAAEALLASLEEWHPEAFVVDGHDESVRPSLAHTEPAEGGQTDAA